MADYAAKTGTNQSQAQAQARAVRVSPAVDRSAQAGRTRAAAALGATGVQTQQLQAKLALMNASPRRTSSAAIQRVLQAKTIDVGDHGRVWVPDNMALTPDDPLYGGTANVGSGRLGYPAATSMEVLVTPNHPQGTEPGKSEASLFASLPTKGTYKLGANNGKTRNGSTLFIKGHLLNDNLGGEGSEQNLFPITHQANVDHDNKVEEPIKKAVNKEGAVVHYRVNVTNNGTGTTDVYANEEKSAYQQYVNATFTCDVTEYHQNGSSRSHQRVISSVWGGTDNSGISNMGLYADGAHVKADAFDVAKVKIMPRAKAREEWNAGLLDLARVIANETGEDVAQWMINNLSQFGKASADLLLSESPYEMLDRSKKGTLTKARNRIKQFLESSYKYYFSAFTFTEEDDATAQDVEDSEYLQQMLLRLNYSAESFDQLLEKMQSDSILIKTLGPESVEVPGSYKDKKLDSAMVVLAMYSDKLELRMKLRYEGVETDEIVTENITQQSLNILKRLNKTANVSTVMHTMPEVMEMMKWGLSA